jgi:sugar lactone lactonase YvrE
VSVAALTVGLASTGPARAAPDALPTYVLPGAAVFPEGISVRGGKYYVASTHNGDIYRGDLREGLAQVFIHGDLGPASGVGLKATVDRIVVAGGFTGTASVYDRETGALVARFFNGQSTGSNVNDVAIAPNGDAYLTDLYLAKVYRIPAAALEAHVSGVQSLPVFLDLHATAIPPVPLTANGIVATSDGLYLILAVYDAGDLYRIRVSDKQVILVDLHGRHVKGPDGMVLTEADVLYVVAHRADAIIEIRLDDGYVSGKIVSHTTSPQFLCPTTDAIAGDQLLVVNNGNCAPGAPPFTVTSIPLP